MFILIDNYDPAVSEYHFCLDQIVHAKAMQTTQEAKTSEEHDGRTNRVSRTGQRANELDSLLGKS